MQIVQGSDYSLALAHPVAMEIFYEGLTNTATRCLTLADRSFLDYRIVALDGITLILSQAQGRLQFRDRKGSPGVHIGLRLDGSGRVRLNGRDIQIDEWLYLQPGAEPEFVLEGPLQQLEIEVDEQLLAVESELPLLVRRADPATLAEVRQTSLGLLAGQGSQTRGRARLLEALRHLLGQGSAGTRAMAAAGGRSFELVQRAETALQALRTPTDLDSRALAADLGIPRRTLFHAFQTYLGIGPRRYLELLRLRDLHDALRSRSSADFTVTEAATSLGFSELGRLAGRYREVFGEYPSETLQRHPGSDLTELAQPGLSNQRPGLS